MAEGKNTMNALPTPTAGWLEEYGRKVTPTGDANFFGRPCSFYYRDADKTFWAVFKTEEDVQEWCSQVYPRTEIEVEFGAGNGKDSPVLVQFGAHFGRQGSIEGLFVTTLHRLVLSIGRDAYFGEVLGKHSDVARTLTWENFKIVSTNSREIDLVVEMVGGDTISGYNPLDYLREG